MAGVGPLIGGAGGIPVIAPPVVIRSKDWVQNKHIKILIPPDQCSPAAF